MLPAAYTENAPQLLRALAALAQHPDRRADAHRLARELSGITVLVARRYTNASTAEGLTQAFYLTVGGVSLGLSNAVAADEDQAAAGFLAQHGAEHTFQLGFRLVRDLANLPSMPLVFEFDNSAVEQQRRLKTLFLKICCADPSLSWRGLEEYSSELSSRLAVKKIIDCARWLRAHHYAGAINKTDLDADGVIAVAVIFAIDGEGRVVAQAGQKDFESLIARVRRTHPDKEAGWAWLLKKIPEEFGDLIEARISSYRNAIIKKIYAKTSLKVLVNEFEKEYAGQEFVIDYP
ncbi:MAG: hypothetical protein V4443_05670 [Pseudomonadota bacterium]